MCDIGTVAFGFAFALFFLSCQKKVCQSVQELVVQPAFQIIKGP
jgi:hypothetical protein